MGFPRRGRECDVVFVLDFVVLFHFAVVLLDFVLPWVRLVIDSGWLKRWPSRLRRLALPRAFQSFHDGDESGGGRKNSSSFIIL
jgi:hypothetical protein